MINNRSRSKSAASMAVVHRGIPTNIKIFPRRKLGDDEDTVAPFRGRVPMSLSLQTIQSKYAIPQKEAAQSLGISLTAFKQVCRKLGVIRWPYRRPNKVI